MAKRRKDPAIIAVVCPVFGRLERFANSYTVGLPTLSRDARRGVTVRYVAPGCRLEDALSVTEGDGRYIVIEENGRLIYDSRDVLAHSGAGRAEAAT